jgi:hypothetical protein
VEEVLVVHPSAAQAQQELLMISGLMLVVVAGAAFVV